MFVKENPNSIFDKTPKNYNKKNYVKYLSENATELQLICKKGQVPFIAPCFKKNVGKDYERYVLFADSYSEKL